MADLRDAVLPVVLAGAAHHEQVAAAEVERPRGAAATRPDPQRSAPAPTLTMATTGSSMYSRWRSPCQATESSPCAVAVEADRVERLGVADAQAPGGPPPARASPRAPVRTSTTPSGAVRAAGAPTSSPCAGATRAPSTRWSNTRCSPDSQPGHVVEPRRAVEVDAAQAGERVVDRRLVVDAEQRHLQGTDVRGHVFDARAGRPAGQGRADSRRGGGDRRPRRRPSRRLPGADRPGRPATAGAGPSCSSPRAPRPITRLLVSGHRVRSVLVTPQARARLGRRPRRPRRARSTSQPRRCWRPPSGSTSTAAPSPPPTAGRCRRSTTSWPAPAASPSSRA